MRCPMSKRRAKKKPKKAAMNRRVLISRAAFRFQERHLWPEHFRGGHRSMRVEWDRLQKMIAELPLGALPEYAQQWIYMLERTSAKDVAYYVRRGDFPYFDAWAHRFHILDEAMKELGFGLPARTPFVYGGLLLAGLAATAQACFHDAGGPKRFESAFATGRSTRRAEADEAEPPE